MAKYQVAVIERPQGFEPETLDAVPAEPGRIAGILAETEDLFAAVNRATEHNEAAKRDATRQWAVVVEPGSLGRVWRGARLCTPLTYKVIALWWPTGWEPQSPLDLPRCVWRAHGESEHGQLSYAQAVAVLRGLNRQSMNHQGTMWYAIMALENEPLSRSVSFDPSGTETTVQVRRLHLVRPEDGGAGDCSHCPARAFDCAKADWVDLQQTLQSTTLRPIHTH
jgi:hypothetical protein